MAADPFDRFRCPSCRGILSVDDFHLEDGTAIGLGCTACNTVWPIIGGIPRFTDRTHYASSFGYQWSRFDRTQIDIYSGVTSSADRLFNETTWRPEDLAGASILEVGSGAGRFSQVILDKTEAHLASVDASVAVDTNWETNGSHGDRFLLAQASIYELPFEAGSFDKVLCLGVLQHTPDFARSVDALVAMARPGGEIAADFYQVRGWWTKVQAKYLLRPITRRMPEHRLLSVIERNIGWMLRAHRWLSQTRLRPLARFIPVVDVSGTFPDGLSDEQIREWAVLDTFDMFSPAHDHPQRISKVAEMFEASGASVTFAGERDCGSGAMAAVVTAVRQPDRD
jgi:SAM-dependent methyltransferase